MRVPMEIKKKCFIGKELRPDVVGQYYTVTEDKQHENSVHTLLNILEPLALKDIADYCSRRKIILEIMSCDNLSGCLDSARNFKEVIVDMYPNIVTELYKKSL